MVTAHGPLALARALKGAVDLKTGAELHHGTCSGHDGTGVLAWRRK